MDAILAFVLALFGIAIGSFLNVCIDRLPAGKSLTYPPSHCDVCQHRLSPRDLIPVFSYLWLRGRCRYCCSAIPRRVFWVELGTGLFFAFTYWYYGSSIVFAVNDFYFCLFLIIWIIDLEHGLILNKIVYPASVVALIISVFLSPGIVDAVIGGAIGFVLLLIVALVSRGGMGWGDIKMAMLIGLVVGYPLVFVALLMGIILGGLVGGFFLLTKIKGRKDAIPFGPFLSLATMIALLWGSDILHWYLRLH